MFTNIVTKVHASSVESPVSSSSTTSGEASKQESNTNVEKSETPTSTTTDAEKEKPHRYMWMIKPCNYYIDEFKDCKGIRERFNQYYIYGKTQECDQWRDMYENCSKWENYKDTEALDNLIEQEKTRTRVRLRDHYRNDVWENREKPPDNWNAELPEAILKEYKSSFLQLKKEELEREEEKRREVYAKILSEEDSVTSSCIIM